MKLTEYKKIKNKDFYYITISNSNFIDKDTFISDEIIITKNSKNKKQISITKTPNKPIIIINELINKNKDITCTLKYNIKKNCKADILELFISANSDECFSTINRKFDLNKNSKLNYTRASSIKNFIVLDSKNSSKIGKDSSLKIITLNSNAKNELNHWDFDLTKKNTTINLYGLVNINSSQEVENIVNTIHNKELTNSTIIFKHILDDYSHAIFEAKTIINKDAKNAKAFQSSQTTLLSDDARINALPILQIYTDELEAKHSATTGALNKEQLYYLQSRGIPKNEALKIVLNSFKVEIIEKIENKLIKEFIQKNQGISYV